jgi:hypothetical protein
MHLKLSYRVAPALLLFGAASCGLINPDILSTTFDLPPKSYSFNTDAWHLPPGSFPEVSCGAGQAITDCCNPPDPLIAASTCSRATTVAAPCTCRSASRRPWI